MRVTTVSGKFYPLAVESDYLWHFIPADRWYKLQTFLSGGLWLARIDTFGSVAVTKEGQLPEPNLGLLAKMPDFMFEWVKKQYDWAVLRSYASSWTKGSDLPSNDHWNSSFGGHGNGIGICTTPEEVSAAIAPITSPIGDGPVYFGSVSYINHDTAQIVEGNTLEASFAIKSKFRDENEVRLLIHSYGANAVNYLLNKSGPFGPLVVHCPANTSGSGEREFVGGHQDGEAIVLSIDKDRFIHKIAFGPRVSGEDRDRAFTLITEHGLASKVLG